MSHIKKIILSVLLCIPLLSLSIPSQAVPALSSVSIPFIILSQYKATADIGDKIYLLAVTSTGKPATWKSSNSKTASVNTYGIVTAKKAGLAIITAKIKNAEASCYIAINKTKITLSLNNASIEHGEKLKLTAVTSNDSEVTWKSSKKSVATIDEYGTVTGIKPGETVITAKADGSTATCALKVKPPVIKLSRTSVKLYRGQTVKITAAVSSKINPAWKTNKKSIATVDKNGTVTAVKNGTATITATVDGVYKTCEVIVQKPDIKLSSVELSLKKGTSTTITAYVSSDNLPVWATSNPNIVSINSKGKVTALKKGTAYIYASEDGTKARCTVKVTE